MSELKTGAISNQDERVALTMFAKAACAIQVEGTWTGTLSFEVSNSGAAFQAISATPVGSTTTVTSTTANGMWTVFGPMAVIQVIATAAMTGVASVTILSATIAGGRGGGGGGSTSPG